jgi:antirestriction protein ArdC
VTPFFAATGATIRHAGASAFYSAGQDLVQMPPIPAFRDDESDDATLAHEMTHNAASRIMPTRLPRPRLAWRRGLRQGLFTEEPWALAGQPGPADDRRDGSRA